jgi:hypothetical protein
MPRMTQGVDVDAVREALEAREARTRWWRSLNGAVIALYALASGWMLGWSFLGVTAALALVGWLGWLVLEAKPRETRRRRRAGADADDAALVVFAREDLDRRIKEMRVCRDVGLWLGGLVVGLFLLAAINQFEPVVGAPPGRWARGGAHSLLTAVFFLWNSGAQFVLALYELPELERRRAELGEAAPAEVAPATSPSA